MLVAMAVAIVVVAVLLVVVLKRRAGGRHDLLAPPTDLAATSRRASTSPPARSLGDDSREQPAPVRDVPESVAAEARWLVARGQKIEAIKIVRAATHWSLGEAKDWVERL